jgi:hypothetical protein
VDAAAAAAIYETVYGPMISEISFYQIPWMITEASLVFCDHGP